VSDLHEPTNHFVGAAEAYARFRADYPDAVWTLLAREVELDGSPAILELGCGPGTATIRLAGRFLGFLCSTSSRPDAHLGPGFARFAIEIDQAIRAVEPSGCWTLQSTVRVILARR